MPRAIVDGQDLPTAIAASGGGGTAFGNGSLGDVVISMTVEFSGERNYNTLNVQAAGRLSALVGRKLTVRCVGNMTVDGAIHADGRGQTGGPSGKGGDAEVVGPFSPAGVGAVALVTDLPVYTSGGGSGGGGGGASEASRNPTVGAGGAVGTASVWGGAAGTAGTGGAAGDGAAATAGTSGTTGSSTTGPFRSRLLDDLSFMSVGHGLVGGGGSGGGGGGGGGSLGGPGAGGAAQSSAANQVGVGVGQGADGLQGYSSGGGVGGGGGSGGSGGSGGGDLEVWCGGDLTIGATGRITARGGNGGNGGTGGTAGVGASIGGGGGGGAPGAGGGGGRLLVAHAGVYTNNGIVNANGGAPGAVGAGGADPGAPSFPGAPSGNSGAGETGYFLVRQV